MLEQGTRRFMSSVVASSLLVSAASVPIGTTSKKPGRASEMGSRVAQASLRGSTRLNSLLDGRDWQGNYAGIGFNNGRVSLFGAHGSNGMERNLGRLAFKARFPGQPSLQRILKNSSISVASNQKCESCLDAAQQIQLRQASPDNALLNFLKQLVVCTLAIIIAYSFQGKVAHAVAETSIGASSLGLKVADFLRRSGLSDEVVVLVVAMLPVLELRGAIPVSYWLKLPPLNGYILSVIGNMIPVPFILLYLENVSNFVGAKSKTGQKIVRWIFEITRKKTAPIEEFHWLGLLLFVAVPLPGTGAWSGAIAACILGMPFWDAVTANFIGVALAGILVNVFVTVGLKEASIFGTLVFASSFFMWTFLRIIQRKKHR